MPAVGRPSRRRVLRGFGGLVGGSLGLAGCSPSDPGRGNDTGGTGGDREPRTVSHALGTTTVPGSPRRIYSMGVASTEHLLALGAPVVASVAGTGSEFGDPTGFLPSWAGLAVERGIRTPYRGFEPDLAAIERAKPDLIIGPADGSDGSSAANAYDRLAEIAPTVLFPTTTVPWQDGLTTYAKALGLERRGAHALADYEAGLASTRQRIAVPPQPTGLVSVTENRANLPLPQFQASKLLDQLGFTMIQPPRTADVSVSAAQLVPLDVGEAIDALDVGTLFVYELVGTRTADEIADDPQWRRIPAVAQGQVYPLGHDTFRFGYYGARASLRYFADTFGA